LKPVDEVNSNDIFCDYLGLPYGDCLKLQALDLSLIGELSFFGLKLFLKLMKNSLN